MMIVHINFPGRNRLFKQGLWDSISIKPRIETVVGWYFFLFRFPDRIEGSNYSLRIWILDMSCVFSYLLASAFLANHGNKDLPIRFLMIVFVFISVICIVSMGN